MPVLTRRAWAKLNLALSVGPPQPTGSPRPGWHPICSWVHAIALADDLTIEATRGESRYEIAWAPDALRPTPIDWPTEQDLAVRAHRLLESRTGTNLPIHLRLTKRIPVGGGLGGGSSNAAAMLMAANGLFALGLSADELADLSRGLGSDVAFFLDSDDPPRPAIVSGFGDRIERLEGRRSAFAAVLVPPFGCSTPAVYRAYDAGPRALREDAVREAAKGAGQPSGLFNDLDRAASAVAPALAGLRAALEDALRAAWSGRVEMTGSGSAMFALAESHARAAELASMAATIEGITSVVTRLV